MNELEGILGKPDWKPEGRKAEIKKTVAASPDAVVLVNLVATCSCGEEYSIPNTKIMLRFGKNLLSRKNKSWTNAYNELPREVRETQTKVAACLRCFADAELMNMDF